MEQISKIDALEILDSRGNPTVSVTVELSNGVTGTAAVPSGASTGVHEALELRDKDERRYLGKGVEKAIANIENVIAPALKGMDVTDQEKIDKTMIDLDGTPNKSNLGANAILGVSLAAVHAAANAAKKELYAYLAPDKDEYIMPVPLMNIINGGKHASDSTDFQEYMVVPVGAKSFKEALRMGTEVYHRLKALVHSTGCSTNIGDEGGFTPKVDDNREAFEMIKQAIEDAGYLVGDDCAMALDAASSEFFKNGIYSLAKDKMTLNNATMVEYYARVNVDYPIISIEDGMAEDDWNGWKLLTERMKSRIQLVGDDLFVTNVERIKKGIEEKAATAVLIKLNQIGTLTETIAAIKMAQEAGWKAMISHRSGETSDTTIADLSVAFATGQIKTGAPCRGERTAKYNRLLRIESQLGEKAKYPGVAAFK
ncbi:MAG: phosphopyruvate hydratase [Dehalococcoidales bacterium]|nr:phosphopyruvate hydratase [Dehalococcoidales bacterium]